MDRAKRSRFLTLAGLVATVGACNYEGTARDAFSNEFSCPKSRVTTKERPDVDAYEATFGKGADPPPEVAKDPERLAMWKAERRKQHESWNSGRTVFQVTGCGQDHLYACGQASTSGGQGTHSSCSKIGARH